MLPVLIVIFLRFGMATPTEVARAVDAVRAASCRRSSTATSGSSACMPPSSRPGMATGVVLLVIMASAAIGWLLTFDRMPDGVVAWAQANLQQRRGP